MPYYKIPNKKFGQNANKKRIGQNANKKGIGQNVQVARGKYHTVCSRD